MPYTSVRRSFRGVIKAERDCARIVSLTSISVIKLSSFSLENGPIKVSPLGPNSREDPNKTNSDWSPT